MFFFFSILMNIVLIAKDSSICVLSNDICILLFSPARYPKDISVFEKILALALPLIIFFIAGVV